MSLTKATFSMINGAVFNVLDYGATGDGTTNDTAAITAAYAAAASSSNGPGVVYFPRGVYTVTSLQFDVANASVHFKGDGLDCSILRKRSGTTTPVLKLFNLPKNVIISELELDGDNQAGVSCLYLQDVANVHVHNCRIWKAAASGILAQSCLVSTFQECIVNNNLYGFNFEISPTVGAWYNNHNKIRDCIINGNTYRGISFRDGNQLEVLNSDIERNGQDGVATTGGIYIYPSIDDEVGLGMVYIDGCWFESNVDYAIYVENASGGVVSVTNTIVYAPNTGTSAGRCIYTVAGLRQFSLTNSICAGGSGTVVINSENFFASNCFIATLSNGATNYTINQVKTTTLDSIQKTTKTEYPAVLAATVQNNTLFHDSSSNKLSWKDGSGVVYALY